MVRAKVRDASVLDRGVVLEAPQGVEPPEDRHARFQWGPIRVAGALVLAHLGIVLFAVRPGLTQQSVGVTLAYGAAFGALAYATFTVTNYAVLNQWTFTLVWTDIAWGTVLTAVVAACGFYAARLVD